VQSVKWKELLKKEFEERIAANPVVYLPMGLCEPHGHIAALGLDIIKAEYLCEEAASRWGGVVAPTQGYQIHEVGYHATWLADVVGNVNAYMTSIPTGPMLYFFLYQLRAFYNAGFNHAIVITGHAGGNQHDFRVAGKIFMQKTDMTVSVFSDPELTSGKYKGDHAGKYEISQLLYLRPDLVDLSRINGWEKNDPESRFAQGEDISEANAAYGKLVIETCLTGIHHAMLFDRTGQQKITKRSLLPLVFIEELWRELKNKELITVTNSDEQLQIDVQSIWEPSAHYFIP